MLAANSDLFNKASATTFLCGALSLSEWALVTGIICSVLTVGLNWYYRHKEYCFKTKHEK
ncbi:holin [Arsenophonus endosymbiont of Aphis craccivora]|nr:phage holin family protein [Arsenophonus endosymbiont of Aphis craccivora]QLK88625.1 holin [Arsenophonus endosymbiont of Aphis craccivora]